MTEISKSLQRSFKRAVLEKMIQLVLQVLLTVNKIIEIQIIFTFRKLVQPHAIV